MKNFGKTLLLFLLLTVGKAYAQPNWSVIPGSYNYSMTITGVINLNYTEEMDTSNMVGAFVGGVCRGVTQVVYDAQVNRYVAYLLVYSNTSGETIDFQVYDASTGSTITIPKTMDFAVNKIEGAAETPYVWSNPTLSTESSILTFGVFGQLTPAVIDSTSINVVMPAGTDITNLAAIFTTSPFAVVSIGTETQSSGNTINDFTNPVVFTVLAEDGASQTNYTVYVTVSTESVIAFSEENFKEVFKAVNAFTPNSDGVNDYWEIENSTLYDECKFNIYNNIGEIVFSSTGYNNDWDGISVTGDLLPVGTYYYAIFCSACKGCETAGFISIVR